MGSILRVVKQKCRPFKGLHSHPLNTKYPNWSNSEALYEISPHASLRKAYVHPYTSPNKTAVCLSVSICATSQWLNSLQATFSFSIYHLTLCIQNMKSLTNFDIKGPALSRCSFANQ